MNPAVVLQHGPLSPPGLLGEWAIARGIDLEVVQTDDPEARYPDLGERPFVCCLGSRHNPRDRDVPAVAKTLEYVAEAVATGIPVLGLCYGGQVLAAVTGGACEPSPEPQHGWYELETANPSLMPAGPWLEWHTERIVVGPDAEVVARTGETIQGFTVGPHLGTQFHPEATVEIVSGWARRDHDTGRIDFDGIGRVEAGREHAEPARHNAFYLFDAFRRRAQSYERRVS